MKKISRRDFVKIAAAGLGAIALEPLLSACKPQEVAVPVTAPTVQPTTPEPAKTANGPDLVVARNLEPEELVRRALAALGGMQRFVPKGASVIVKPNICVAYHTYEYAATTNPWVVAALVRLALEAGARQRAGDGLPLWRLRRGSLREERHPGAGAGCRR